MRRGQGEVLICTEVWVEDENSVAVDVEENNVAVDVEENTVAVDVEENSVAVDVEENSVAVDVDVKGRDEQCGDGCRCEG